MAPPWGHLYPWGLMYIYMYIFIFLCHIATGVCVVYIHVVKEVASFQGGWSINGHGA